MGDVAVRCLNWNVNFLNYCEDPVKYFLSALHGSTLLLAAAFWPTLETKPPFCFLFPHSPRRHYEIVCGAVFQMRDILLFQSEQQGGTQLILTWRTHGI